MTDTLKPCPFCGSDNVKDTTPPPDMSDCEDQSYYWVCPDCVCCGPIRESLKEATEAWNTRKDDFIERHTNPQWREGL